MRDLTVLACGLALGACSAAGGRIPSLERRSAETIDPRLPVPEILNNRPASAALVEQLSTLIAEARRGDAQFSPAIAAAERLAAAAGPIGSESWIAAQQALSAAEAARAPTARALGDIDALGAEGLAVNRGIAPRDLAAIEAAAAQVSGIAGRQAGRLDAVTARLGD